MLVLLSAPAGASPPSLQTVGAKGGLVTGTWSMPTSVSSEFFEVAKYPDVNVYGYFRQKLVRPGTPEDGAESQVRFGVLGASQTSLTADDPKPPLPAGVYYVHIAGHDRACGGVCALIEFSESWRSRSERTGTAPPPGCVAPGTGSGGGGVSRPVTRPPRAPAQVLQAGRTSTSSWSAGG